eukprot:tig00000492_g1492.t1
MADIEGAEREIATTFEEMMEVIKRSEQAQAEVRALETEVKKRRCAYDAALERGARARKLAAQPEGCFASFMQTGRIKVELDATITRDDRTYKKWYIRKEDLLDLYREWCEKTNRAPITDEERIRGILGGLGCEWRSEWPEGGPIELPYPRTHFRKPRCATFIFGCDANPTWNDPVNPQPADL